MNLKWMLIFNLVNFLHLRDGRHTVCELAYEPFDSREDFDNVEDKIQPLNNMADEEILRQIFGPHPEEKIAPEANIEATKKIIGTHPKDDLDAEFEDFIKQMYGDKNTASIQHESDKVDISSEDTLLSDVYQTEVVSTTRTPSKDDIVHVKQWLQNMIDIGQAISILLPVDNSNSTNSHDKIVPHNKSDNIDKSKDDGLWKDLVITIAVIATGSLLLMYAAHRLRECVRRDYYLPDPHIEDSTEQL